MLRRYPKRYLGLVDVLNEASILVPPTSRTAMPFGKALLSQVPTELSNDTAIASSPISYQYDGQTKKLEAEERTARSVGAFGRL